MLNRRRTIMDNRPTIVWNQLIESGVNIAFDVTNSTTERRYIHVAKGNIIFHTNECIAGHKYILRNKSIPDVDSDSWGRFYWAGLQVNNWIFRTNVINIAIGLNIGNSNESLRFYGINPGFRNKGTMSVNLIDLTLMFGAGNEPTSVAQFEQWFTDNIGSLDTYYPYNAGQEIKVKYLPKDM